MKQLLALAAVCMAMLGTACTGQQEADTAPAPVSSDSPIVRDGKVYTPMSIGPEGCLLYNIRIPGGDAPAAMVYQSADGEFTFGRPDRCVKAESEQ